MAKRLERTTEDELRAEYDLDELGPGVRGKYYRQAKAGTNLVLIEPDLAKVFPDQESVNRGCVCWSRRRVMRRALPAGPGMRRDTERRQTSGQSEGNL